jgi:hypothetical protein
VLVALDAGHGGRDSGAISALGKAEKHYTLAQSLACGSFLIGAGMDVKFTRTDDTFVTLRERARLANEWGVDAFLSFHWNSSTSPPDLRRARPDLPERDRPDRRRSDPDARRDTGGRVRLEPGRGGAAR